MEDPMCAYIFLVCMTDGFFVIHFPPLRSAIVPLMRHSLLIVGVSAFVCVRVFIYARFLLFASNKEN